MTTPIHRFEALGMNEAIKPRALMAYRRRIRRKMARPETPMVRLGDGLTYPASMASYVRLW